VGEWRLTLTLPPSFKGRNSLEVVAKAAKARASKTLQLAAAAPSKVIFQSPPRAIRADGHSAVRVPLQISDDFGNLTQAEPKVTADRGTANLESSDGSLYANYVPPLLNEPGQASLLAKLNGSIASTQLMLLPQVRPAAFSPKLGFLSNFDGFSAPFAGVEAALRSDRFGPQLSVALEVDFTQRSQDQQLAALNASSRISILFLHLSASYRYELNARTTTWLALGPSLAGYSVNVSSDTAGSQGGTALSPGASAALGVERRLGFAVPFVELRGTWITRPELPSVSGPLRILSLALGARFEAL
jgi:hypothetical protein